MKDKIAVLLGVLFLIGGFIYTYQKELQLNQFGIYTSGKILSFNHTSKTQYEIKYIFFVKGVRYKGGTLIGYFKCDDGSIGCVGNKFDVIYSSKNPKINEIILGKYEEEYYGRIRLVPLPKKPPAAALPIPIGM